MTERFDAAVVGAGIIGASCAYYLARSGLRVAVLEAGFPACGASGACNGGLSLLGKRGALLDAAHESLRLYSTLEWTLDAELGIDQGKTVLIAGSGDDDGELLAGMVRDCAERGFPAQLLDRAGVEQTLPGAGPALTLAAASSGGFQGTVNPFKVVRAYLKAAEALGASVFRRRKATALLKSGNGAAGVAGADFEVEAGAVVVCAGIGSAELIAPFGYSLPIEAARGVVLCTERSAERFPVNLMDAAFMKSPRPERSLAIEQTDEGNFLIGSTHEAERTDGRIEPETMALLAENALRAYPPLASRKIIRAFTGIRPMMANGPFVDRIPGTEGLFAAAGHGGMGITLAPWTGTRIAGLVSGTR